MHTDVVTRLDDSLDSTVQSEVRRSAGPPPPPFFFLFSPKPPTRRVVVFGVVCRRRAARRTTSVAARTECLPPPPLAFILLPGKPKRGLACATAVHLFILVMSGTDPKPQDGRTRCNRFLMESPGPPNRTDLDVLVDSLERQTTSSPMIDPPFRTFVAQILKVIKMGSNQGQDRYRVVLSDGLKLVQGVLATQLNHLVANGQIVDNATIRISDYVVNPVKNGTVTVILAVDVVDSHRGQNFGNPSNIEAEPPPRSRWVVM